MAYKADISRKNPGCFIFLVDQSASMEDPFGGEGTHQKAEELSTILNRLIHNLSIRCAKSDSIYDYFFVGLLGYSQEGVKSVFGGDLSGRDLVSMSDLVDHPLRVEDRVKNGDDGHGGTVEDTVKFPVWYDPSSQGGTPMCAALKAAQRIVQQWATGHASGFPPIVINITDGDSTDGDPLADAQALCSTGTDDGPTILFNVHLSSTRGAPIELPSRDNGLPDEFAKKLFEMSSKLTPFMVSRAREVGMDVEENSRGFVFNAQPTQIIQFLDIGTRPANLR